jgi:hypothetical protein
MASSLESGPFGQIHNIINNNILCVSALKIGMGFFSGKSCDPKN